MNFNFLTRKVDEPVKEPEKKKHLIDADLLQMKVRLLGETVQRDSNRSRGNNYMKGYLDAMKRLDSMIQEEKEVTE